MTVLAASASCFLVSGCGAVVPPTAPAPLRARSFRSASSFCTSTRADTCVVSAPPTFSSPSVLASVTQRAGVDAQRRCRRPWLLGQVAVGGVHVGLGLLVVLAAELHERAVAGGQQARLQRLALAARAQLHVHVQLRQLVLARRCRGPTPTAGSGCRSAPWSPWTFSSASSFTSALLIGLLNALSISAVASSLLPSVVATTAAGGGHGQHGRPPAGARRRGVEGGSSWTAAASGEPGAD